ncbi:hypothetical protein MTO96_046420 [Rhipicephalus appendiculatus]
MPGGLLETAGGFSALTKVTLVAVLVAVLSDVTDESCVKWDADESWESELSLLVSLSTEGGSWGQLATCFRIFVIAAVHGARALP